VYFAIFTLICKLVCKQTREDDISAQQWAELMAINPDAARGRGSAPRSRGAPRGIAARGAPRGGPGAGRGAPRGAAGRGAPLGTPGARGLPRGAPRLASLYCFVRY
jgi:hypothetical protein